MSNLIGAIAEAAGSTTNVTVSHTLAAAGNRTIFAVVRYYETAAPAVFTSCTYDNGGGGAVAMTEVVTSHNAPDDANGVALYQLLEASMPADGTYDVYALVSRSCNNVDISVFTYDEMVQEVANDFDPTEATATTVSTTNTPEIGSLMISAVCSELDGTWTEGTGQTSIAEGGPAGCKYNISIEVAATAADTQTFSHDGASGRMAMVTGSFMRELGRSRGVAMTPLLYI